MIRCRVGSTLGRLGDPRFHDERLWCLPKDPMLGFVEVPAGSFIMGTDDNHGSPILRRRAASASSIAAPYLIARYPVSVAQFAAFVTASKRDV